MGCHTWFSVPVITDKNEIIKIAQDFIDSQKLSNSMKKMYQYAVDNELIHPILELSTTMYTSRFKYHDNDKWILYKDVKDWSIDKIKKETGIELDRFKYDDRIEVYSDEPRIGGYPTNIIRSYDEMIEAMNIGIIDEEGKHLQFYWDKNRYEKIIEGIKTFFEKHPDGIITFG